LNHISLWILKTSEFLQLHIVLVTSVCTSAPILPSTPFDHRLLVSKYRTILRYHNVKHHDISISSLGYDMNPTDDTEHLLHLSVTMTENKYTELLSNWRS